MSARVQGNKTGVGEGGSRMPGLCMLVWLVTALPRKVPFWPVPVTRGKGATLGRKALVRAVLSIAGWELHGNHSTGNPQNVLCAFGCRLPKDFP